MTYHITPYQFFNLLLRDPFVYELFLIMWMLLTHFFLYSSFQNFASNRPSMSFQEEEVVPERNWAWRPSMLIFTQLMIEFNYNLVKYFSYVEWISRKGLSNKWCVRGNCLLIPPATLFVKMHNKLSWDHYFFMNGFFQDHMLQS